jgi:hypothetical protein
VFYITLNNLCPCLCLFADHLFHHQTALPPNPAGDVVFYNKLNKAYPHCFLIGPPSRMYFVHQTVSTPRR